MRLFDWLNERRIRRHQIEMRRLAIKGVIAANVVRIIFAPLEMYFMQQELKKPK